MIEAPQSNLSGMQLERNAHGRLVLTLGNGLVYEAVVPVRAFPIAAPAEGLSLIAADGKEALLVEMSKEWPFFRTRLEMLEMVFLKADMWLSEYYDQRLAPENLWPLGQRLRAELKASTEVVLRLRPQGGLLEQAVPGVLGIAQHGAD